MKYITPAMRIEHFAAENVVCTASKLAVGTAVPIVVGDATKLTLTGDPVTAQATKAAKVLQFKIE